MDVCMHLHRMLNLDTFVYMFVYIQFCTCVLYMCANVYLYEFGCVYGVATISRLLKIGAFCRISSLLSGSYAKETYDFKEPTNGSHPIVIK